MMTLIKASGNDTNLPSCGLSLVQRENDVLIFKSPHYSHFLLSIKHDEVVPAAVLHCAAQ